MDVRMAFFDAQPESEMVRVIRIKKRKYFIMIYFKFTNVFNSSQCPEDIISQPQAGNLLIIALAVLAIDILFNYLTVRALPAVPNGMNNNLMLCELIVDYEISNDQTSGSVLSCF